MDYSPYNLHPQELTAEDMLITSNRNLGRARSIHRIVTGPGFVELFESLTHADKVLFAIYTRNNNSDALKALIKQKQEEVAIEEMSLRRLRLLASEYKIPYYTRLDRANLIREIKERQDEKSRNAAKD